MKRTQKENFVKDSDSIDKTQVKLLKSRNLKSKEFTKTPPREREQEMIDPFLPENSLSQNRAARSNKRDFVLASSANSNRTDPFLTSDLDADYEIPKFSE